MNVNIEPRKPTDRGGYLCLPLYENVPTYGERHTAELVECPECGRECWRRKEVEMLERTQGVIALCTACALRKGMER